MGQRHQVYVIFKDGYSNKTGVHAFHAQWSYGTLPIRAIDRLLTFSKNAAKNGNTLSDWRVHGLSAVLSADMVEGEINNHFSIQGDMLKNGAINPDCGDNNDGISIIDIRNMSKPKYGLMFLFEHEETKGVKTKEYKILNAKDYVRAYYKDFEDTPAEGITDTLERVMSHKLITPKDLVKFAKSFKDKVISANI